MYQTIHRKILPPLLVLTMIFGMIPGAVYGASEETRVRFDQVKVNLGSTSMPGDFRTDAGGNFYLADKGYVTAGTMYRLKKYNASGQLVWQVGENGTGPAQFMSPNGLDLDNASNVYVADYNAHRIVKYSGGGAYLDYYAGAGTTPLSSPYDVAVNKTTGDVYVADSGNKRIVRLNSSLQYVAEYSVLADLDKPISICLDADGNFYAGDQYSKKIVKYNPSGGKIASVVHDDLYMVFDLYCNGNDLYASMANHLVKLSASDLSYIHKWPIPSVYSAVTDGSGKLIVSTAVGSDKVIAGSRLASDNNFLSSISVQGYSLSPAFDKNTTGYTVNVDHSVSSVTITPAVEDPTAKIQVNGRLIVSGTPTDFPVGFGDNLIRFDVTADCGEVKAYTVNVKRAVPPDQIIIKAGDGGSIYGGDYYSELYVGEIGGDCAVRFDLSGIPQNFLDASLNLKVHSSWSNKTPGLPFVYKLYGTEDDSWTGGTSFPASNDILIVSGDADSTEMDQDFWKTYGVSGFVAAQRNTDDQLCSFVVSSDSISDYICFYGTTDSPGNMPYLLVRIPAINKSSVQFDKNIANQGDVSFDIVVDDTVSGIQIGAAPVSDGSYSVSGSTVTLKKEFLATLPTGDTSLTVVMGASSPQTLTVEVEDTTPVITDFTPPTITSVTGNPSAWQNTDAVLTVTASDEDSGLAPTGAYSFDGGATWQTSNSKSFSENESGIIIKVKDGVGNISTYETIINISKIDKTPPLITSVSGNPDAWQNTDVILTVAAADAGAGISAAGAYSFDGGVTWQNENSRTYSANTTGIVIKVRDSLGNISGGISLDITKIDKTPPINAKIELGSNIFTSFLNTITFGLFFKDTVTAAISANCDISGQQSIQYQKLDSESEYHESGPWTTGSSLNISPNFKGVIYAKITDNAGNVTIINTNGFTIDDVDPEISLPEDMQNWSAADVTVPVLISDNLAGIQTAAYTTNEALPQSGTVSLVNGTGSITLSNSGSYTLTVTAADCSGNSHSGSMQILIDKVSPAITVTGNPTFPAQSATLNIAAGAGVSGYSLKVNGTPHATGTYTVTANGTYTFTVTNGAGVTVSDTVTVTNIDRQKPVVAMDAHGYTSGAWTNDAVSLTFRNLTANLGATSWEISVNGGAYNPFDGSISIPSAINDLTVRATSASGVVSDAFSASVKIDKTAPAGTITQGTNHWNSFLNTITFGLFFKETVSVSVGASDEGGSGVESVQYYKSATALSQQQAQSITEWASYASALSLAPADAEKFIIYARITDHAGNATIISSDGMEFDLTAPVISTNYAKDAPSMEVTVTDSGSGVGTVTYTVDGGSAQTAVLSGGKFTVALPEGKYPVIITASDALDNEGSLTVNAVSLYTVAFKLFDGDTGAALKTETVEYGDSAAAPSAPARTGFVFKGWDKAFGNITSDLTVNGKWEIGEITVTPYSAVFDGSSHNAVTVAGVLPGDHITYSTDGTSYGPACPQYTGAGSYPVYVKAERAGCAAWESGLNTAVISSKDITGDMIADIPSAVFTNQPVTPLPEVTFGGVTLIQDTDYVVNYSDNTGIGLATVRITGKGNYTGTASKKFAIYAKNTSVTIKDKETPPVMAEGLENLYADENIYTQEDRQIEQKGGTVKIDLSVQMKTDLTEDKTRIENAAPDKTIGLYLDLSLYKTVLLSGEEKGTTTRIGHLDAPLAITIPIPENIKGRNGISLYRVHNGVTSMIPVGKENAADGEYCMITEDAIVLYACNFSTYAIGYDKTAKPAENTGSNDGAPETGGRTAALPVIVLLMSLMMAAAVSFKRKKPDTAIS